MCWFSSVVTLLGTSNILKPICCLLRKCYASYTILCFKRSCKLIYEVYCLGWTAQIKFTVRQSSASQHVRLGFEELEKSRLGVKEENLLELWSKHCCHSTWKSFSWATWPSWDSIYKLKKYCESGLTLTNAKRWCVLCFRKVLCIWRSGYLHGFLVLEVRVGATKPPKLYLPTEQHVISSELWHVLTPEAKEWKWVSFRFIWFEHGAWWWANVHTAQAHLSFLPRALVLCDANLWDSYVWNVHISPHYLDADTYAHTYAFCTCIWVWSVYNDILLLSGIFSQGCVWEREKELSYQLQKCPNLMNHFFTHDMYVRCESDTSSALNIFPLQHRHPCETILWCAFPTQLRY